MREKMDLSERAHHDGLTGLLNWQTFQETAGELLSNGTAGAVLVVDTDDFKGVNDTYGHLFGDEVILTVASAVRDGFRSSDITGRIGGDEFAVFARDAWTRVSSEIVAARSLPVLPRSTTPMATAFRSVWVSVSILGTVKTTPTLFSHADAAFIISKNTVVKAGMPYTANNGQGRKKQPRRGNIRFLAFFSFPTQRYL